MTARICDHCGQVDDLPRDVILCTPDEAPPVNLAMVTAVIANDSLTAEEKAAIVADLNDNTLMLRHLDPCPEFGA